MHKNVFVKIAFPGLHNTYCWYKICLKKWREIRSTVDLKKPLTVAPWAHDLTLAEPNIHHQDILPSSPFRNMAHQPPGYWSIYILYTSLLQATHQPENIFLMLKWQCHEGFYPYFWCSKDSIPEPPRMNKFKNSFANFSVFTKIFYWISKYTQVHFSHDCSFKFN